jgi:hypothetical protein
VARGFGKRLPWRASRVAFWSALGMPVVFLACLVITVACGDKRLSDWSPEIVWEQTRIGLANVLFLSNPPERSAIPVVEVLLGNGSTEGMNQALLFGDPEKDHDVGGDKPYFPCYYIDESGKTQRGKACLRGLNYWHHRLRKPSLRVKIKKAEVEMGRREVELSRPEDPLALCNLMPEAMARDFGLMSQVDDHVALYLNNRFAGVYLRGYRANASLAVANGRLEGTFFKGDLEYGMGLWKGLDEWAVGGQDSPLAREAFERLLTLRAAPSSRRKLDQVARLLDVDAMARWSALNTVCGTAHSDDCHNQVFFFDPRRGLLEPVVWDPNGFGVDLDPVAPVDMFPSPIEEMFAADPAWVHQRNLYLAQLLGGLCGVEALQKRVDGYLAATLPWLRADPDLGRLVRTEEFFRLRPYSVIDLPLARRELSDWTARRRAFLQQYLAGAEVAVEASGGGAKVTVFGHVAVEARGPGGASRLLFPGLRQRRARLSPDAPANQTLLKPTPIAYELPWKPARLTFRNAVTGQKVAPGALPVGPKVASRSLPVKAPPAMRARTSRLGPGLVWMRSTRVVESGETLEIAPGTRLALDEGVSLVVRGKLLAEGSPKLPITVGPWQGRRWGVLALLGPGTGGSRLSRVTLVGGSTSRQDYQALPAMLSVQGCPDLAVEHCTFAANAGGQDAVRIAESQLRLDHCLWTGAPANALALEACRGRVEGCRFEGSGRNGLVLCRSRVAVSHCEFVGNDDKGLYAHRGSDARVAFCTFTANARAVQASDDSVARLSHCLLQGNPVALDAYRKTEEARRGGTIEVVGTLFPGPTQQVLRDKRSAIRLDGKEMPVDQPEGLEHEQAPQGP